MKLLWIGEIDGYRVRLDKAEDGKLVYRWKGHPNFNSTDNWVELNDPELKAKLLTAAGDLAISGKYPRQTTEEFDLSAHVYNQSIFQIAGMLGTVVSISDPE